MDKHNFVTIADLTREKILYMIEMAEEFEKHPNRELLKGKVVLHSSLSRRHVHDSVSKRQPTVWELVSSDLPIPRLPVGQKVKPLRIRS